MKVLGIDASTKTGLVFMDGEEVHTRILSNAKLKGLVRLQWISRNFNEYLDTHLDLDCAVIEGYAYANKYTLATLVEIGILLRLSLHSRGIPCYICPPSVLKKFCTGKGNSKKPELATAVAARWGYENPSDDVIDAYVLARIAQKMAQGASVVGLELLL